MSELPDFLGGEPDSDAPIAEAPAPAAAEAPVAEGQARGPDGKFAAAEPVAETPPAEAAPAAPVDAQGHVIPLATFLDMRDRTTAAEKEAKELREWRVQQEAKANAQPPPKAPDREADPKAYEDWQQQQFDNRLYADRRSFSQRIAVIEHGQQTVDAAFNWGADRCDVDPYFNQQVRASQDPVGFVVKEWRQAQALAKVSDPSRLDAFLAWEAAQAGGQASGAPASSAAPPVAPAAPRASLAASPSAGASSGAVPQGGEEIFNEMFGPKGN